MAGNYTNTPESISINLGKLTNLELVPRKGAESTEETATLQQEAKLQWFCHHRLPLWSHKAYNPGRQTADPA